MLSMNREAPGTCCVSSRLPARPASVPAARAAVAPLAKTCGADESAVALCVSEAVTNAVLHAYRDGRRGDVRVHAWIDEAASDRALRVSVEDDGVGMSPRVDSPGLGVGLSVIATMATAVDVRSRHPGCAIQLTFACGQR
jgi:anti-sigma regulatory factor (Ser/Thr protein kinase)